MQVSKNDTTLAHALAKQEIENASDKLHAGAGARVLSSPSVKAFFRNLEPLFSGRIIDAVLGRVFGSRASASVIVCDTDTGGNLALTQLCFDAKRPAHHRVTPHPVPVIVQQHALARVIQRVTGTNSLGKAVVTIQPHLHAAVGWVRTNYPLEPGTCVSLSGRGLEIAGQVDANGMLRLKTVIDADGMTHAIRKMWAEGESIEVRETYRPSNKKVLGKALGLMVLDEASDI